MRPIGSIVPVRLEPDTWLQLVDVPRKMLAAFWIEMLFRLLALLTSTHSPSRYSLNCVVPESLGSGARVLTANTLCLVCTSLMPALPPSAL